jgi:glycosyltransferase involved in cell wall biosynthesis
MKPPLTVCFFSHLPELAGAERTLLELVTELIQDYGVRCGVVVPGDGPLIPRLQAVGAGILRTRYSWWCDLDRVPETEARRRMDESVARLEAKVIPAVAKLDPDVICTQTIVIPWGALVAAKLGKPHIWNLREQGQGGGLHFFRPFEEVSAFIREHSDFLFGANKGLCTQVVPGLRPEDHDVLYPVVDVPSVIPNARWPSPSQGPDGFRLVEFATIAPSKRLDVVIGAVADLAGRGRSVELVIAGPSVPAHVAELEALMLRLGVRDRVHIEAFMNDVSPVMVAADAVVISAPVHSFGRTAAEAMALAKPVVYPLGTGFDDYLEDGMTGLGYSVGDPHSMADRVDHLIRRPVLALEIGLRAQASARATFTRDGFGGKFYRRALALKERRARRL